jgi:hypothetical protein
LAVGALAGAAIGVYAYKSSLHPSASTSNEKRPSVLPAPIKVVEVKGKLTVHEHTGNASNGDAGVSIAQVQVSQAMDEAIQVPGFDEYVLVTKGTMKVFVGSASVADRPKGREDDEPFCLIAHAGQMLHLPRKHLYRYNFPGPCEYVPVCLPAFKPEIAGRIE